MSDDLVRPERRLPGTPHRWLLVAVGIPLLAGLGVFAFFRWTGQIGRAEAGRSADPVQQPATTGQEARNQDEPNLPRIKAPELEGGVAWLNTSGPITLRDLKGKIVLLDFWTLCCINCIHTLPDLAKLEKKYPNQLVVIGIHSAKFENEKSSESIRKAILRYEISHPVVNDANMRIWRRYAAQSWPTLYLIDPEGYIVGRDAGEGLYEGADALINRLIQIHRKKKTLDEQPLSFNLARFKERGDSPLFFPGKVLADATGNRLFIADSTHHRIVITDLQGKKIAVAGTGEADRRDGPFDRACFNDPQGMALQGDTLFVADRKNHLIRALDLKNQTVKTVAGTSAQGQDRRRGGPALKVSLNSPWDLYLHVNTLFIAMAGHHQIWTLDLREASLAPYAGTGRENIADGALLEAEFAQPSGLTSDGTNLYVADSEISAVRSVPAWGKGEVKTIVGEGLFEFGDHDGVGSQVRLQHALGVAYHDGLVYVADTYNSKIKVIDPAQRSCTTVLGGKNGGWLTGPLFSEPGGLSITGDKMYVADTNNHRIRVVDLKTKAVSTLELKGVKPPSPPRDSDRPFFPNPTRTTLPLVTVPGDGELTLQVELGLPLGFKLNPEAQMSYLVETLPEARGTWSVTKCVDPQTSLKVTVPAARLSESAGLRFSLLYYECADGAQALCRVKSRIWDIPLKFDKDSRCRTIQLSAAARDEERK
jgi:thiol-disulfide isomerase/thioredoxin